MRHHGGVGTRILAVEDDERIRSAVKLALEDEGWTVDEAESGEQAIEMFQRSNPDVVLIDIMLPGIDGFELCRTLRRTSDVPVVMVTARNDTHDIVAGLEAGADDYLTKPFAPKELSASSHSRRNSVLVRWTSAPSRSTLPSSGISSRSPKLSRGWPDGLGRMRRSSARILAESSFGANGLVR